METLYHGCRAGFRRGGLVLPRSTGHKGAERAGSATDDKDWAFATTDFDMAAMYARHAKGRGRPKVLTVQPVGRVEVDPSTYDGEEDQYRCEALSVLSVQFVPEEDTTP